MEDEADDVVAEEEDDVIADVVVVGGVDEKDRVDAVVPAAAADVVRTYAAVDVLSGSCVVKKSSPSSQISGDGVVVVIESGLMDLLSLIHI